MSKKILLGIVVVILLVGADNLLAMEKEDRPKEKQMQKTRRQAAERAERSEREVGRRREGIRQRDQGLQQFRQNQPVQQMAGRWLDELTKAYQENDREKMGQLIRKMHQLRQRVRQGRAAAAERVRALRETPGPAIPPEGRRPRTVEKPRPRTDEDRPRMQPPKDVVRPLTPGRSMGGWGQGFQGRGMGGWGRGLRGRGMGGWGRGPRGRGMGGWGRGLQGRGMGGWGRGLRGRGMGQGFPGPWCPNPWCPWLQDPVP